MRAVLKYFGRHHTVYALLSISHIGAILSNNCSILFKSLKVLTDNTDLKIALDYLEQKCKITVVIIEKSPFLGQ
jgi:hypothetical protein